MTIRVPGTPSVTASHEQRTKNDEPRTNDQEPLTPLIRDLIDIPERVQKGDCVLKLVEDIKRPDVVLGNYVVTPELAKNFDAALTFIRSALTGRTSKATGPVSSIR